MPQSSTAIWKATRRGLFLLTVGVVVGGSNARAASPTECFTEYGLAVPAIREAAVALVDATTFLPEAQRAQARDLIAATLQPGTTLHLYIFARGPGLVQRVGTFALPLMVNDIWRVGPKKAEKINGCIADRTQQLRQRAAGAVESILSMYKRDPTGESPIVQAMVQVVGAHPTATRLILITDAIQHQSNGGYTLYDQHAAPGSQSLRKFDPKVEVDHLASLGLPSMNRSMRLTVCPVGQPEPGPDGTVQRRLAAEVDRLIEVWRLFLQRAGAAPNSTVTSFVPALE